MTEPDPATPASRPPSPGPGASSPGTASAPGAASELGTPADPGTAANSGTGGPSRQVRLRRAPRYRAFGATGLLVGVVLALLVAALPDAASATPRTGFGPKSVLAYLIPSLGLLGLLLGLGVALLMERRRRR